MSTESVESRLKNLYVEALRLGPLPLSLDDGDLIARLNINSILAMEIMVGIELCFGIELDTAKFNIQALNSISELAAYLREHAFNVGAV